MITFPPGNMYGAINRAMESADTHLVGYANSDDSWYRDSAERLVLACIHQPHVGVVYGDCDYIDSEGRLLFRYHSSPKRGVSPLLLSWAMPFVQTACVLRKPNYDALRGFDAENFRLSAGLDFFYRAMKQGVKFEKIEGTFAKFRLHKD